MKNIALAAIIALAGTVAVAHDKDHSTQDQNMPASMDDKNSAPHPMDDPAMKKEGEHMMHDDAQMKTKENMNDKK